MKPSKHIFSLVSYPPWLSTVGGFNPGVLAGQGLRLAPGSLAWGHSPNLVGLNFSGVVKYNW